MVGVKMSTLEQLIVRAATARDASADLIPVYRASHERTLRIWTESLVHATDHADVGRGPAGFWDRRSGRLGGRIGRDPAIHEAKLLLRGRYDITGGEAYQLLRELSQRRNQKVAVISRGLLASSTDAPAAAGAGEERITRPTT
jgi:hypothetical protein